uniref:ubiquitinyl hydrolase 1 n=1 Tax=Macrostomum lignano TaxID=282301 RepID=A0A1I8I802_9PLAT
FGNTCYCNSVLQALYYTMFRERVLVYKQQTKGGKKDSLLTALADLFHSIASQKRKVGTLAPKKFIQKLKRENEAFDNFQQQDAHEFFNYLINHIADILVRQKDENFLDLSVDIEQNSSLLSCLKCFSNLETMQHENKYFCEFCSSKQEATKRMKLKKLPLVLALHLKRFKFIEQMSRHVKVNSRVVFPLELSLSSTFDESNPERVYDLVSVVVHCGCGPNRGHYITIVKSHGLWLLFDDDIVEKIDPSHIEEFYGLGSDSPRSNDSGYLLFYQARDPSAPPQPTTAVPAASAASTATTTTATGSSTATTTAGNSGHSNQGSNSARPARGDRA